MELKIVDFGTAKRLNKIGFPLYYDDAVYIVRDCYENDSNYGKKRKEGELVYFPSGLCVNDWITAPTLELVKKWLLEENKFYIEISPCYNLTKDEDYRFKDFIVNIHDFNKLTVDDIIDKMLEKHKNKQHFEKYDDALEWGIKKVLSEIEK